MNRFALIFLLIFFPSCVHARVSVPERVRHPVAAGAYYPADAKDLNALVSKSLENAVRHRRDAQAKAPKAIIAPAESLFFSSEIMGKAYAPFEKIKPFVKRVVLVGAANPKKYFGTALTESAYWETPSGRLTTDTEFNARLAKIPGVGIDESPFSKDYALELHLPYIYKIFGKEVKIVPVLIGDAGAEQLTDLFEILWGGMETVVIVASNLSNGLNEEDAFKTDRLTAQKIDSRAAKDLKKQDVSAFLPVSGFLMHAQNTLLEPQRVDVTTTAAFLGDKNDVTGMGAWRFYETKRNEEEIKKTLENDIQSHQETLLKLAAQSVRYGFKHGRALRVNENAYPPELRQNLAVFVHLYHNGTLRGSMGRQTTEESLIKNIAENAYAAAFQDFRYVPLEESELKDVEISISFLMPKTLLKYENTDDLVKRLRPNIDGLYLKERANTSFFLPSVWEIYPNPEDFLTQLKRKAGLPPDYTSPTLKIYRFEVLDINSGDFENPSSLWQ